MLTDRFQISGQSVEGLAIVDQIMAGFLTEHHIPGGALAIMKDDRLVYARGFGYADIQAGEFVQPGSLFRIASVSKPFTAVAIMRLVEEGRLRLEDKVFELLDVDAYVKPGRRPDPRIHSITIQHLLNHSGGWDRSFSGDAMFKPVEIARDLGVDAPAGPMEIIRWMAGYPLDFDPGTRYAYSNFGYCLLGRVIEKIRGKRYDASIQEDILSPLGINRMRIGSTHMAGRAPGEVVYYPVSDFGHSVFQANLGKRVPENYGAWYVEAMDAHGGWIASAPDLVRFASALDYPERYHLLTRESVQCMFAPPPPPLGLDSKGQPATSFYACGWAVDLPGKMPGQQHHNGMLPGTASILRRREDGICWAAVFNRAIGRKEVYVGSPMVNLMNETLTKIDQWPQG